MAHNEDNLLMKWLRLYSEVLDDPKVQQLHPAMFKHWINLLCLASQTDDGGHLPDEEAIAFRLRVRKSELRKIIDTLCAAGLLDRCENSTTLVQLSVHKWSERQRKSDDVAQRVARYRAETGPNVTLQETLLKRPVEEDTEEDKKRVEKKESVAPDKPSPVPKPPTTLKPLPENGPAQKLVALWSELVGVQPSNYGRSVGEAQKLVNAGVDERELRDLHEYLLTDDWWASKGFSLGTVVSQLDKLRVKRKTPQRNGHTKPERVDPLEQSIRNLHAVYGKAPDEAQPEPTDIFETTGAVQ